MKSALIERMLVIGYSVHNFVHELPENPFGLFRKPFRTIPYHAHSLRQQLFLNVKYWTIIERKS